METIDLAIDGKAIQPPVGSPKGPALIRVEQVGPEIRDDHIHQYFRPILCIHCPDAPYIDACPQSAIYKDSKTGCTLVDQDECLGCKSCLQACPYGAPQFSEEKLRLCDLCIDRPAERRGEGRYTACQAACPARAIYVGAAHQIAALLERKATKRDGKEP